MKALVWLTHSFRSQSKLFSRACSHNEVAFVYYSPYYYDDDFAIMSNSASTDQEYFFRYAYSLFHWVLGELGHEFYLFKKEDPISHINELIKKHGFDKVIIDKPLFNFPNSINTSLIDCEIEFIDSDIYSIDCHELDPRKRVDWWIENYIEYSNHVSSVEGATGIKLKGSSSFQMMGDEEAMDLGTSDPTVPHFIQLMQEYYKTNEHNAGTFRLSGHLQHGIVDPGIVVYQILVASLYDRISGETWHLKPLLQMAKRELAIIRSRKIGLQPYDDVIGWAEIILDNESLVNLTEVEFQPLFSKMELFEGITGDDDLDEIVEMMKTEGWLHHSLRKWISSKIYYGNGGGVSSLETLIEFFNKFSVDGQSPSTMINCIESYKLVDGEIPKYDTEDLFNTLGI